MCEDLLDVGGVGKEGKSTLDGGPLFAWQLLFCVRPDLCSPWVWACLGAPSRKCGAEEKKKVDSERLADKAPTRLGLFCLAAAKFDPVSPESYQDSVNQKKESRDFSLDLVQQGSRR